MGLPKSSSQSNAGKCFHELMGNVMTFSRSTKNMFLLKIAFSPHGDVTVHGREQKATKKNKS